MLSNIPSNTLQQASSTTSSDNTVGQLLSLVAVVVGIGLSLRDRFLNRSLGKLKKRNAALQNANEENKYITREYEHIEAQTNLQLSTQYLIQREILARTKAEKHLHPDKNVAGSHELENCNDEYVMVLSGENDDPKDALEKSQQLLLDRDSFINAISTELFCEQQEKLCESNSIKMTR
jgi:hypothetical protein